jgi:hypothetical protein
MLGGTVLPTVAESDRDEHREEQHQRELRVLRRRERRDELG